MKINSAPGIGLATSLTTPPRSTSSTAGDETAGAYPQPGATADSATISEQSRARAYALALVHATPPVRVEPVQALHARLADGTYQIDDARLARAVIRHGAL